MNKGWQKPDEPAPLNFVPPKNYEDQVARLTDEVNSLNQQIKILTEQKDLLISDNAHILKDKIAQADAVIVEQHKIKDVILSGATELATKQKQLKDDKDALQQQIYAHHDRVEEFNKFQSSKSIELLAKMSEAKKKETMLQALEEHLNEEQSAVVMGKSLNNDCSDRLNSISKDLDARQMKVEDREKLLEDMKATLDVSVKAHRDSAEELEKRKEEFRNSQEETKKAAEENAVMAKDISAKIDKYNNLVIQSIKILNDIKSQTTILKTQEQKNQASIAYLENLKADMVKQGEQNVEKTAV